MGLSTRELEKELYEDQNGTEGKRGGKVGIMASLGKGKLEREYRSRVWAQIR